MDKEIIERIFGKNKKKAGIVDLTTIMVLAKQGLACQIKQDPVDVSKMYYELDVQDIIESDLTETQLEELSRNGFSFLDSKKNKLVKYIENV